MPDVAFKCPYCGMHMEADEALRGAMINCPECGGLLRIPGGGPQQDWLLNFDCPACAQNIEAPADAAGLNMKCPACGQLLVIPAPAAEPTGGIRPVADLRAEEEKKGSTARIDLAREVRRPQPQTYHIKIKRSGEAPSHGSASLPQGFHASQAKRGGIFGSRA